MPSCPDSLKQTPTFFKLGFGGRVALFPEAYDYVYNPLLRWTYAAVFPRIAGWSWAEHVLRRLRSG